jgi:hypothetical protein
VKGRAAVASTTASADSEREYPTCARNCTGSVMEACSGP